MARDLIPEEERSQSLRYYYAHRAECNARNAAYRKAHPRGKEYEAFRVRKYRAMHPEQAEARLAYQREYYRTHREARLAYQREYYRTHREARLAYKRAYQERKKAPASVTAEAGQNGGDAERNKCQAQCVLSQMSTPIISEERTKIK